MEWPLTDQMLGDQSQSLAFLQEAGVRRDLLGDGLLCFVADLELLEPVKSPVSESEHHYFVHVFDC